MGVTCGTKCAKITLAIFNLVFFIGGLVVMGIGIWMLVDKSSFVILTARMDSTDDLSRYEKADTVMQQAAYLLITGGVIVFIVAFLGCCGALKEWRPLLVTYAVFLMIVLGLEIAAGIYAGIYRNTASDYLPTAMRITLTKRYQHGGMEPDNTGTGAVFRAAYFWTNIWNKMMIQLDCCGINSGEDFNPQILEQYRPPIAGDIPLACCKFTNIQTLSLYNPKCAITRRGEDANVYSNIQRGCLSRISSWLDDNLKILIGVGIGIGLLQIFGIVFAFCLCMAIQSDRNQSA